MFVIQTGEDWKVINGEKTGISQVGSAYSGATNKIVWNLPFELTY